MAALATTRGSSRGHAPANRQAKPQADAETLTTPGDIADLLPSSDRIAVGTIHSLFTLSPDGKSLTRLTHYSLNLGDFDTKTIFDKQ